MAEGLFLIYAGAVAVAIAAPALLGRLLWRHKPKRGLLVGLILGVLLGPIAVNLAFFDAGADRPDSLILTE